MDCRNKKALLAGATGGIGQAIAGELAEAGAQLTLLGRSESKLSLLQRKLPGNHRVWVADLNRPDDLRALGEQYSAEGLDIFVNAVGVMDFGLFERQDPADIESMLLTNLLAPMLLCRQLLPALKASEQAAIVNIGSIFGSIGHPGFTAYCASKFGLRGFTEALQRELHDSSVRVSYLAPRATQTDFNSQAVNDLNAALGNTTDRPEQVAREVMRVLRAKSHQRYLGWPERLFVRLNGLFPSVVHRALSGKLAIIRHHAEH